MSLDSDHIKKEKSCTELFFLPHELMFNCVKHIYSYKKHNDFEIACLIYDNIFANYTLGEWLRCDKTGNIITLSIIRQIICKEMPNYIHDQCVENSDTRLLIERLTGGSIFKEFANCLEKRYF